MRAAEHLLLGAEQRGAGTDGDLATATSYLLSALTAERYYDPAALEAGGNSDRGSERMRAVPPRRAGETAAHQAFSAAVAILAPHREAIGRLAAALLAAPDQTLSGDDLRAAITEALGPQ